jgi:hypothetical protein
MNSGCNLGERSFFVYETRQLDTSIALDDHIEPSL